MEEISAAGVILNQGKVAIVFQNKTKTWALPKGHLDEGESLLEAAKREMHEETGITELAFVKELGTYQRGTKKDPEIIKKITVFFFTTTQNELKPIDPENPEAKWINIDDVFEELSYEEDKDFFSKIKSNLNTNFLNKL